MNTSMKYTELVQYAVDNFDISWNEAYYTLEMYKPKLEYNSVTVYLDGLLDDCVDNYTQDKKGIKIVEAFMESKKLKKINIIDE